MKELEEFMNGTKFLIENIIKRIYYFFFNFYYKSINFLIFKLNKVNFESNFQINGIIFIRNKGNLVIGKNFKCNSGKTKNPIGGDIICRLIVKKNATLKIGNNVGISNSTLFCTKKIEIGNNVLIGGGCKIWDTDFHSLHPKTRTERDDQVLSKAIIIGDNVFIGGSCIILKGVKIGSNSIIGAGSVVTKNIPPNEIWAGNPAKFIKKLENVN